MNILSYFVFFIAVILIAWFVAKELNKFQYSAFLKDYNDKEKWYSDNFNKYTKSIKAFNESKLKNNDIVNRVKDVYKDRKDKLQFDEIEMKDIINNLEKYKDNYNISIFLACLGFLSTITAAICNKTKDNNYLIFGLLSIFLSAIIGLIYFDTEAKKYSRKIAFYNLCLEIIIKIEEGKL